MTISASVISGPGVLKTPVSDSSATRICSAISSARMPVSCSASVTGGPGAARRPVTISASVTSVHEVELLLIKEAHAGQLGVVLVIDGRHVACGGLVLAVSGHVARLTARMT